MTVYTKTGDRGQTGTFGGKRVSKSSKLINAIGVIDELNSYLGIINTGYKDIKLVDIQKNLFTINAILTGAKLDFSKVETKKLEKEINLMEGQMPVLANFIIYSGTSRAVKLYYARALCRRAERLLVKLRIKNEELRILPYINRLSDYLFTLARYTNFKKKVKEEVWMV
ncbi:MAG: ATP/cobalamin adenosyltransferase [Candidatus Woesebacteria bacterium GW2011_GWA1_33_30]|uniref:Corrinoid adenosyltransferase n=1 Tax=Candidatus Woesebacteria bacterium GW2011_GWA2_33_28 TaxID=1618561 RepID=A0A0G0A4S2_9BACT|nr:MAG: ATP/cobalamin adenosyltransferase [Candidatus Woesebacteria bacterium GW2011_GWA2_33_28]KKP46548.1 MAG: ATP/cobalamin adenosyltransferase [Candidatus Woesebacteria bacterium GW2011_GWA1_33_30]KKP48116.1 MAG: ATP/cobalamin adenosyltransferase [Microgenomates group bacterium GW2011_GWC1_33_32]KKP52160.1 MAG: ATP/cobalamin adenosyltransferase [Candidatus Woesebacteria bacterium GW2011_GWB1_33_38]KKP56118.1 MAG: ATP/cobalamin adenosyltransferase [Microgenomates group bacterium GW2011_GWD1_3